MNDEPIKGFLDIDKDTEYRRKLAVILRDIEKVRRDEEPFIKRLSGLLRRFTNAEADALDVIFRRYKTEDLSTVAETKADDERWES
jgi:hypothetical protein